MGPTVVIHLEGLVGLEQRLLADVLARRLPTFARNFPARRRRNEEELVDPAAAASPEAEAWDTPSEEEIPDGEVPEDSEAPGVTVALTKQERLLLMKKRGKRILIIMHDDLDRACLAGILQVDGFSHVMEARNYAEALGWFRVAPIDLVILDQQVGAHPGQKSLERLRGQGYCIETPVVLVSDHLDVRVTIMAKALRIAHLQKKPIDFDGELRAVLYRLLRIA